MWLTSPLDVTNRNHLGSSFLSFDHHLAFLRLMSCALPRPASARTACATGTLPPPPTSGSLVRTGAAGKRRATTPLAPSLVRVAPQPLVKRQPRPATQAKARPASKRTKPRPEIEATKRENMALMRKMEALYDSGDFRGVVAQEEKALEVASSFEEHDILVTNGGTKTQVEGF